MFNLILSIYIIFLPFISNSSNYLRGVAATAYTQSGDMSLLRASWYHKWVVPCDYSNCVPLSEYGEDTYIPEDYSDFVILFNEPDASGGGSATLSVANAILDYNSFVIEFPNAKIVAGNILYDINWLVEYKNGCDCQPYAWGIHAYFYDQASLINTENRLTQAYNLLGGIFWVTEWADVYGNINNDESFMTWMKQQGWIERASYFTNRYQGNESWFPLGWNVNLIEWGTNILTPIGQWFANEK